MALPICEHAFLCGWLCTTSSYPLPIITTQLLFVEYLLHVHARVMQVSHALLNLCQRLWIALPILLVQVLREDGIKSAKILPGEVPVWKEIGRELENARRAIGPQLKERGREGWEQVSQMAEQFRENPV